jgi:hypothetical protein
MTTHQPDRRIPEDPDPRFWLGVFLPTAAAFFAALALVAGWSPQLPAEVAQQWDWSTGQVSTVGPLWLIVLSLALPAAAVLFVLAVFKWSGKLNGWGRRLSVALPAGIAVFLSAALPAMLSGQLGIADPAQAPDPRSAMALAALLSVGYALLAALIAGSRPLAAPDSGGTPVPALDLAPGERAVWTTAVTAWVCLLGGGIPGLTLILVGLFTPLWGLTVAGAVLLVPAVITGRWRVTVDHRGLTCTTLLGLGRFHVPAGPGATAEVVNVRGLSEFLGWGIRVGGAGSVGLIFRNGEALRVHGRNGKSLTVTARDAATAASLFTAVASRSTAGH